MIPYYSTFLLLILILTSSSSHASKSTDYLPNQIHLAFNGHDSNQNPTGVTISYQTTLKTAYSQACYSTDPDVLLNLEPKNDNNKNVQITPPSKGTCKSYYKTYDHHVRLENLLPDTVYYYIVGDPSIEVNGLSKIESFTSAALSEDKDSIRFAAWGDLGLVNGGSAINYLKGQIDDKALRLDLMFHVGDVGYGDDSFTHIGCWFKECYEKKTNEFMRRFESVTRSVAWHVMPGNHEIDCHDPYCASHPSTLHTLSNFTAYNSRFSMPSLPSESNGNTNMYHSFNYGPVHFIALDLETGFPGAAHEKRYVMPCGGFYGDMVKWLEDDLIEANRDIYRGVDGIRPWIVIGGHHPMYSNGRVDSKMWKSIGWLLDKYNVDVMFVGHVHQYERNKPIYNGAVVDGSGKEGGGRGTVHVMVGGAGNDEMPSGERRRLRGKGDTGTGFDEDKYGVFDDDDEEDDEITKQHLKTHKFTDLSAGLKEKYMETYVDTKNGRDMIVKRDASHYGIGIVEADRKTLNFKYVQTSSGDVADEFTLVK